MSGGEKEATNFECCGTFVLELFAVSFYLPDTVDAFLKYVVSQLDGFNPSGTKSSPHTIGGHEWTISVFPESGDNGLTGLSVSFNRK